jgi:hypothetical protein
VLSACLPVPPPETPEPPVVETPEPEQATLAVVVTDAASGAPVASARVELHTGETGTTNVDGYLAFELVLGERGVTVSRAGYYTRFLSVRDFTANRDVDVRLDRVPPPPPPPPLPPPPVDACGPMPLTADRTPCLRQVAAGSTAWARCRGGDGHACHLYLRSVARAMAAGDARWGLITKSPGEQQCDDRACGRQVRDGYGEDVLAFRLDTRTALGWDWQGWDIVNGAGAVGATYTWAGVDGQRPANRWAPVP